MILPIRGLSSRIDREHEVHVVALFPLIEFVFVDQIGYRSRAIDDGHLAVLLALVEARPDNAPGWRQGDASGDEEQVLALELLDREAVAVRPAEGHDVTCVGAGQSRGDPSRLAEGALDVIRPGFRTGYAEGAFTFAVNAVQSEHSGPVMGFEELMIFLADELQFQSSHAGGLFAL